MNMLKLLPGVEQVAVCDVYEPRLLQAAETAERRHRRRTDNIAGQLRQHPSCSPGRNLNSAFSARTEPQLEGHRRRCSNTSQPISAQMVEACLADTHNDYNSICKAPNPALAAGTTSLQTLCSIVMDLNLRTMWISDGALIGK